MLAASQRNFLQVSNGFQSADAPSGAPSKPFPKFPAPPRCMLAPSQRNSPQAISNLSRPSTLHSRFLSSGALPKLFPQSSVPFTLRSAALPKPFPVRPLQPSYFHGFLSFHAALFLELLRTYCRRFLSVHAACSLPPSEALLKKIPMVSQSIQAAFLLPPSKALPKLSPMVSCLSRSYFARRPVRPRFGLAPPHGEAS